MMMIGWRLLGGVGGPPSRTSVETDLEIPPSTASCLATLARLSIEIGRRGRGARILGGRCSSGMP